MSIRKTFKSLGRRQLKEWEYLWAYGWTIFGLAMIGGAPEVVRLLMIVLFAPFGMAVVAYAYFIVRRREFA